jgi:hypothetical protein
MCGDNNKTMEIKEADFDRTVEGMFNAGRYEQVLERKLTEEEIVTFTDGFIPASVVTDLDGTEYYQLS